MTKNPKPPFWNAKCGGNGLELQPHEKTSQALMCMQAEHQQNIQLSKKQFIISFFLN